MKVGVILFHKKIPIIYKIEWITLCLETLNQQTYQDFDILEICYGEENISLCEIYDYLFKKQKKYYWHKVLKNHIHAQNFLLNKAFKEMDYDVVFNVNLDDFYSPHRFEIQLEVIKKGYDLVSSNFTYIEEGNYNQKNLNVAYIPRNYKNRPNEYIKYKLNSGENIIAHPCVAYTRNFWENAGEGYPDEIPKEDFLLWKRMINKGMKFFILPHYLLFYRIHGNQITYKHKRGTYAD